ncbi:bifunctional UDP-N-acetylglucosamine pyrophosphorylase / Glucosamine-1-phosphate N-acetyltransferase [Parafrankia irregularis]|uniref:Bifunctional protein GlmU n=1 Tax=Parafrankia irregularis TaxID=795642 RepID=A0A0S4QTD4_9ACTN|nr:bifunctional UDP-N-acetylglucosamine diphosphorylase/glucosamine-1-phosphate N-acetyltransferase GlmU [Parafrankia sp. CH37]MBE3205024.1 bifunctional UDP-N-acetylglucosamine diphosphorylase/glucosamine-1-phosphate N-acetyltransferase GlmU [Parafrankia sp. CH37]CUU58755.1 bifunctional UDP-N-acetylglucosamine pyrophosphorylase / Glucosamine-1-phosphate N-acetyltransferase [Parafrankia irregularis]
MTQPRPAAVIVLAAGEGRRMRSKLPKVLHRLAGRTLLEHVLHAATPIQAERTVVVVGHGREQVTAMLADRAPHVITAVQEHQGGTGHAVRAALGALGDLPPDAPVIVLPGDVPLLTREAVTGLVEHHHETAAAATILTAAVADPTGYGRIVRGPGGRVREIVEQRDADAATAAINEINTGVYVFDVELLRGALKRLTTDNAQGEEYLTDVVGLLVADSQPVAAHVLADAAEAAGVNDRRQLGEAGVALRDRIVNAAMLAGTTIVDPASTWIDADVRLEPDTTLWPNTRLRGATRVAAGAEIGPDCTLIDTVVGTGARVTSSVAERAEVGPDAVVGPFAHLRPGTRLGRNGKIGAFVETKAAEIGADSKVPHLAYVGDAVIGERSNIGCTTVFVNYDGVAKHRTVIGSDVRIGSDTMLVAPVTVGDGAYTGAGSVIREDVPPGALAVREGRQRTIVDWVLRRRPDSPAARAAEAARSAVQRQPET